jgi:hypothetical protein
MKISTPPLIVSALLSSLAPAVFANSLSEDFFQKFISNMHHQDASLADLYAEDATIQRLLMQDGSIEEVVSLTGKEYKTMIKSRQGKNLLASNSDFSNVDFFTNRDRIAIKAKRYSRNNCYTDYQYYIVIDKQADGNYKIVNERIEKPMHSSCKAQAPVAAVKSTPKKTAVVNPELQRTNVAALAKQEAAVPESSSNLNQAAKSFEKVKPYVLADEIALIAEKIEPKLPLDIDKNTQLISTSFDKKNLNYNYSMPKYTSKPDYNPLLEAVVKPNLSRQLCAEEDTKKMLEHGGVMKHSYSDKNNEPLFSFTLTKESCLQTAMQSAKK